MKSYYCTHCLQKIDNIIIEISIALEVDRKVDTDWEIIHNSKVINSEFVCQKCFKKFSDRIQDFKRMK